MRISSRNSKLQGWFNYPTLTLGYRLDRFALSFETRLLITTSLFAKIGDLRIQRPNDPFAGVSLAVHIEQPLWKDRVVAVGVRAYWTKLYYPAWAAFPAYDRHYWIPELLVGLIL